MGELQDFFLRLSKILQKDTRYREEAYLFVMAALGRAVGCLDKPRHITGPELLQGIKLEAEQQFGPMATTVFEHWGVKNSLDFGRIVFNMVREGILSKTENDVIEDFDNHVFFESLFDGAVAYRLTDEPQPIKHLSNNSGKGV